MDAGVLGTPDRAQRSGATAPAPCGLGFDVVAIVALGVVATLVRVGSLPSDGLWFDDSWVAAGAILGTPSELLTVGSGHPGFTFVLMLVDRLGGGLRELGVPSLLAGIAGPMALYVALRSVKYERSIAVLHERGARRSHRSTSSTRVGSRATPSTRCWCCCSSSPSLSSRGGHGAGRSPWAGPWRDRARHLQRLPAGRHCGAGVILVLHPQTDRRIRLTAVGAQALVQALYLRTAQTKSDLDAIEAVMETRHDGHITFHANPIEFVRESLKHLRRVAEVFPSGSGAWLTLFGLLAIGGLVVAAVRGRAGERLVAQFSLLMIALAFAGALVDRFPFGPANFFPHSPGGRHTLWLVPAMALGLAAVAHRAAPPGRSARAAPLRVRRNRGARRGRNRDSGLPAQRGSAISWLGVCS